jgi:hypothetical protein
MISNCCSGRLRGRESAFGTVSPRRARGCIVTRAFARVVCVRSGQRAGVPYKMTSRRAPADPAPFRCARQNRRRDAAGPAAETAAFRCLFGPTFRRKTPDPQTCYRRSISRSERRRPRRLAGRRLGAHQGRRRSEVSWSYLPP